MPSRPAQPRRRLYPEVLVVTAIAALVRFVGLGYPRDVVFDEFHFEKFTSAYLTGAFYHDVHPPLAKLLLAGAAHLLGIAAKTLAKDQPAPALRILPAIAGTILVPLFWLMLRQLRASRRVAFLGALCAACDNALVLHSRLILIDIFLLLFGILAIDCYLAARRRAGTARWAWMLAAALSAGLSASVKWTGLSALGLIMMAWFVELVPVIRRQWRRFIGEGLVLVVVPVAVYLATFVVHVKLLPNTGPGVYFVRTEYRATLKGDVIYRPDAKFSTWDKIVDINEAMKSSDISLRSATHTYASKWYTWPIMLRPIHYWMGKPLPDGRDGDIYLIGNVVVWWGSLLGMGLLAWLWVRRRALVEPWRRPLAFLAFGYAINYLPFAPIQRILFLYAYLEALLFAAALGVFGAGVWFDWMGDDTQSWEFSSRNSARNYWGLVAFIILGFLFFSPETYGWPISYPMLKLRLWLPTWG